MRVDVRVRIDQDELFEFVKETLSEIAGTWVGLEGRDGNRRSFTSKEPQCKYSELPSTACCIPGRSP